MARKSLGKAFQAFSEEGQKFLDRSLNRQAPEVSFEEEYYDIPVPRKAKEQGYSEEKFTHVGPTGLMEYDLDAEKVNAGLSPEGIYTGFRDPDKAKKYAERLKEKGIDPEEYELTTTARNVFVLGADKPNEKMVEAFDYFLRKKVPNAGEDYYQGKLNTFKKSGHMDIDISRKNKSDIFRQGGAEALLDGEDFVFLKPEQVREVGADFEKSKIGQSGLFKTLAPTAVALGLVSSPEEAEAAYIPLKAFAEGTDAAKALYQRAMKRIEEGADTRPNGELYNEMGVYRSEDGDLKVDLAELKARDIESTQAVAQFDKDLRFYLESNVQRKKDFVYPITRYLPKNSPIFENFPELADAEVEIAPRSLTNKGKRKHYYNQGFYLPPHPINNYKHQIVVTVPTRKGLGSQLSEEDIKNQVLASFDTLIHEFQHYIQDVKKAANQGFNSINSKEAFQFLEGDYNDAVEALEKLQPGDPGYAQYKDRVDTIHDMTRYSIPNFKDRKTFMAMSDSEKAEATKKLIKEFKSNKNTLPSARFQLAVSLRELGEAEARSSAMKGLIPEGELRKSIGVFYPDLLQSIATDASGVGLRDSIPNTQVFVRAVPEYNMSRGEPDQFQFSEFVGTEIEDAPAIKQLKKNRDADKKNLVGTAVATGTAAGVASPPSEAFVEDLGERTGLFEDGSPTPSLFDVEGVSDELGISNTFLLDLLVPRTKPYDLISNIPGVGETMMGADLAQGLGSPDAETPDEFTDVPKDVAGMRQGGGIETEAGLEMEEKNPNKPIPKKADINKDGEIEGWEKARHEAIQKTKEKTEMAMGGMMGMMADPFAPFQVTVDIDEESGNEVPAGSKEEEVRDDIPAMLSEGEYVVPADVVRYHGLKTFEQLRCEAKHAMGLMAMHGRISMVDDETKEPVDYDIEEKDKPEVEKAEVKVIEAAEGTDVQPASEPTTFYQLQYKTDPVTGQVKIVYVDPLTGEEVRREEYEEERASRFAPQKVLERDVFSAEEAEEEAVEEAVEEEADKPCPPGFVRSSSTGACVPVDEGDGAPDTAPGPGRYGMSEEGYELEDGTKVRSTDAIYSRIDPEFSKYTKPVDLGPLGVISPVIGAVANIANKVGKEYKEYQIAKSIRSGDYLGITPSTPEYGDWRNNMAEDLAASVAESEFEARDIVSGDRDLGGSSFASNDEAQAVSDHGWGSDEHFDAIEAGFDANTDQDGLGREGTDEGDAGDTSSNTGSDLGPGESPTGDDKNTPFAKGGMPVRKVKPRVAMMNYSKGSK